MHGLAVEFSPASRGAPHILHPSQYGTWHTLNLTQIMKRYLFAALLTMCAAAPAHASYTCTRDYGSSVNLRNAPNRGARVIASIPAFNDVYIYTWVWGGDNMRWVKANVGGLVGWIRSDYVCN